MEYTQHQRSIIQRLEYELVLTYYMYNEAAKRIHNHPMATRLRRVTELRRDALNKLMRRVKISTSTSTLPIRMWWRFQLAKFGMSVDSLLIRRNEREILTPIVSQEKKLIKQYRKALAIEPKSPFTQALLEKQLEGSIAWYQEVEQVRDQYDFAAAKPE